ncbi:MAG: diacylglycerol kinase family lipid kinase [Defluviitaleaceae bacterium]|nr:diacylglycerol kinase family lipid kinase [Defluviitaleaceae bacterium]
MKNRALKKLKLIYTHTAGNGTFKTELDTVFSILSPVYDISIFRANDLLEIKKFMQQLERDEYHTIVAAGGDGTINTVASAIISGKLNSVLGIIPAGTSNDFARKIGIERSFSSAAELIRDTNIKEIDIGFANDRFFINVFGIGILTNVSNYVNQHAKSALGNMAYYFKGLEKMFQKLEPMRLKVTTSNTVYEDEFLFLLALNSGAAGGFDKLVKNADISDGVFDFIGVVNKGPATIPTLFIRLMMDEHLTDERVIYFKDRNIKIESLENKRDFETNVDGERGPKLPIKVSLEHKKLKIYGV